MWRPLVQLAALVLLHSVPAVDVHGAVGVDGHHHLTDVAVDPGLLKPEDAGRFSVKNWGKTEEQVCMWQEELYEVNIYINNTIGRKNVLYFDSLPKRLNFLLKS